MSAPRIRQAGESRSRRIESLRALAALGVLVGHCYGWAHGYAPTVYAHYYGRVLMSGGFGVFLFFALSGYLLYLPFARAAFGDAGAVSLGRYARNRAVRILPLYYVVIAVFLLLDRDGMRSQWWRFVLFLENFSAQTVARLDGPVWSLVVEMQFYVLLPLFAWLVARLSRRRLGAAVAVVAACGAVALAVRVATVTTATGVSAVWRYSLPATAVFFTPGLLLALTRTAVDTGRLRLPRWAHADAALVAGTLLWLVVAYRFDWDPLLLVASALLIGACALPVPDAPVVRLLDLWPIAALGTASYSLYLWHEPIVARLAQVPALDHFGRLLVVALVVGCAVAAASYLLVESPFLRLRRSWSAARAAGRADDDAGSTAPAWHTPVQRATSRSTWTPTQTPPQ